MIRLIQSNSETLPTIPHSATESVDNLCIARESIRRQIAADNFALTTARDCIVTFPGFRVKECGMNVGYIIVPRQRRLILFHRRLLIDQASVHHF